MEQRAESKTETLNSLQGGGRAIVLNRERERERGSGSAKLLTHAGQSQEPMFRQDVN
jgi:hypothetical protein